jgi:hypothetical protein
VFAETSPFETLPVCLNTFVVTFIIKKYKSDSDYRKR